MEIRFANDFDKEKVIALWNYCFSDTEEFVKYYFENVYEDKNTVVVIEDEDVLSALQLNKYNIKLKSNNYDVSYVVGVSSKPEIRGLGCMKKMMKYTLDKLYESGEIVSLLMAIDYRLYKRYGFEHCYDQLQYSLNTNELSSFRLASKLKRAKSSDAELLSKIYLNSMKSLNGYVNRDKKYFERFIKEIESEGGHIYINEEKNAYITYYIQDGSFFVREIMTSSISALKSILGFIYNHNTQCKTTIINTPLDDKIRLIIDNLKTCEIKLVPFMAARMINFEKYIETLKVGNLEALSSKRVVLEIEDKYISKNNGAFEIYVEEGKLKTKRVDKEADIKLDINSIAQLAFSYLSLEEVFMIKDIDEGLIAGDKLELLNFIFEKKVNYIDELV